MSVALCLVRFCSERKNFVVDVEDVEHFSPKHVDDFKEGKKYKVKWPILKREESMSSTTAEAFDAWILLLAVDEQSMIHRAIAANIRLPPAFLNAHQKEKPKRRRKREQVETSKKSSKKAKKDIVAASTHESRKRMLAIASKHLGGNIVNDTVSPSKTDLTSPDNTGKHRKIVLPVKSPLSMIDGDCTLVEINDCNGKHGDAATLNVSPGSQILPVRTPLNSNDNVKINRHNAEHVDAAATLDVTTSSQYVTVTPLPQSEEHAKINESSVQNDSLAHVSDKIFVNVNSVKTEAKASGSIASTASVSVSEERASDITVALTKKHKKNNFVEGSDDDTSVTGSDLSLESSRKSVPLFTDRNQILCDKLAAEQRVSRKLRTELTSKELLLTRWKDAFKAFNELGTKIIQDEAELQDVSPSKMWPQASMQTLGNCRVSQWVNSSFSPQPQSSSGAVKNLFNDSPEEPAGDKIKGRVKPHSSPKKSTSCSGATKSLSESPKKNPSSVKKLFTDHEGEQAENKIKGHVKPHSSQSPMKLMFRSGASKSPFKSPSKNSTKSPGISSKGSSKSKKLSGSEKSSGKSKEQKLSSKLGPHEKGNRELAPMILDALKNTRPLQGDGAGKVHIGNNVYILEDAWNDSIAPSTIKISMAIKNLVSAIWTVKEGAKLSVTGGKSPKTQTCSKSAVPLGILHAIYGVYRAKMMIQGVENNDVLDLSVSESAKKYVRERLSEMSKSLQREELKIQALKEKRRVEGGAERSEKH